MSNFYQNYHKHTSLSHRYTKDSSLTYEDYFNEYLKLAEQGIPTIYSTVEHGWQSNYFHIYDELEKFNKIHSENNPNYCPIKFVFGTEGYWVKDRFEKDNMNCHIILIAKNENGRKKLNRAIYESFKSGYYYKNRMDLDIILSLPKDDIMVTTACIAFYGYDKSNNYTDFSNSDEIIAKLWKHFSSFYLEVQANLTEPQKRINQHLVELHNNYNIPLIAGTDSHEITMEQMQDRDYLLKSSNVFYEDEEGWFMDVPNYETLFNRFIEQGVLSESEIREALENTNDILKFEDIVLNRSLKVPCPKKYQQYTQEERNEILKNIAYNTLEEQKDDFDITRYEDYKKELNYNLSEVYKCGMTDYFLMNYEVMKLGQEKYGGILTPTARGSGSSFLLNRMLNLTKVDKVTADVGMYAERFLTATRILESHTPPDIDHNVSDRQPFIEAQKEVLDNDAFDLLAIGKLKYKSAFKMFARANDIDIDTQNAITKCIDKYEEALKHKEEDEEINIYDFVDKEYHELIDGCQKYRGIVDNLKAHPCGNCCGTFDIVEEIGVIMVKSESQGESAKENFVAIIESIDIDHFGILKQDYLIVDSIGLTYDIYKEIGMKPLTITQVLKLIKDDKKTWDIYKNGRTMCINQVEQKKSTEKAMRYKPKNIVELTMFIAGIRPSFQSMYNIFENRQHFDYGIKAFDDIIQTEFCDSSFIIFQEDLMKVLGFAGFPMVDTYTIIKAVSKKKTKIIKDAKDKFIPSFTKAILDSKETDDENIAMQNAQKVWDIIVQFSQYGFCLPHAYCMALDSVTLAYLKAHYPLEFYKVCLQRYTDKGDKNKATNLKREMIMSGINIKDICFGDDNRTFSIDKNTNSINQTMGSIKNVQKITPQILYQMSQQKDTYKDLFYIFYDLKNSELNKKSLDIIFKLNYFREYGDINYIIQQWNIYNDVADILERLSTCKQLKKDDCYKYGLNVDTIKLFANKETEKQLREIDNVKLYNYALDHYQEIVDSISKKYEYRPIEKIEQIAYELAFNGYTDKTDSTVDNNVYCVSAIETNKYGTTFITLYHVKDGTFITHKIKRSSFAEHPCDTGDIVKCIIREQYKKIQDENGKWVNSDELETIIKDYTIIKKCE